MLKTCKHPNVSIPVTFEGGLESRVRAEIINELFKYILYERQQIPLPFDQIKRELKQSMLQSSNPKKQSSQTKKAANLVPKIEESMKNIIEAFEICPEIKRVMFTIGATTVSPKEVYVVELPPLNPEAENLPGKVCLRTLFRQLIMQDPLGRVKQISVSSISVLLYGPRHSNLSWFLPKPAYKIPVRGSKFEFQLTNDVGQGSHDLSKDFSIIELSGFEPFNISTNDISWTGTNLFPTDSRSESSEESITADYVCVDGSIESDSVFNTESDFSSCNNTPKDTTKESENFEYCASPSNIHKRMKKSSSASSILSQTSVMQQSTSASILRTPDLGSGIALSDTEHIWYQSPITIKGFKMMRKA
ncbi:MAD2L1-binding protein-like [Mya arenaria]|uniref:MAD2L1-binding protein-like n=1 Tax=Mya arenaria TaxID=6604 RepID=UPI0022DF7F1D|nr:MAD2L1-binding protein-like [Mya arenaria]